MRRFSRQSVSLVAAAAGAAACIPLPGNRELSRQLVARKEAENTLVSDQGATCRVKGDVFETVNVGDEHRCVWKFTDTKTVAIGDSTRGPIQDQAPRRPPGRPGRP